MDALRRRLVPAAAGAACTRSPRHPSGPDPAPREQPGASRVRLCQILRPSKQTFVLTVRARPRRRGHVPGCSVARDGVLPNLDGRSIVTPTEGGTHPWSPFSCTPQCFRPPGSTPIAFPQIDDHSLAASGGVGAHAMAPRLLHGRGWIRRMLQHQALRQHHERVQHEKRVQLLQSRPGRFSTRRPGPDREDEKLTASQARELQRRVTDLRDQTRYLLVSNMGPRFALYYNVSDDVYVMNDPRGATLFKRRNAALAVKALLGPRIRVIRCGSKRLNGVQVPVLHGTPRRRTTTAGTSSSPNQFRMLRVSRRR